MPYSFPWVPSRAWIRPLGWSGSGMVFPVVPSSFSRSDRQDTKRRRNSSAPHIYSLHDVLLGISSSTRLLSLMFDLTQRDRSRSPRRRSRSPRRRRSYSPRSRSRSRDDYRRSDRRSRSPMSGTAGDPGGPSGYGRGGSGSRTYEDRAQAKEQMMASVRESSQQERRVYVGNLSYDVKWHHLKDFMRQGWRAMQLIVHL